MNAKIALLDKLFSAYIRQRDCPDGIGRCITCGVEVTPYTCDAGHYISRSHLATRWNERNVHAQCPTCNRYYYGKISAYRRELVRRYGEEAAGRLEGLKHATIHIDDDTLDKLIKHYKEKLKNGRLD